MTWLRPILAWSAAAVASAAIGATVTIALVVVLGFWEWPFLGWVWLGLAGVGLVLALVIGGATAAVATGLARIVKPARPAADILCAALGAFAILMGVRAFIFVRSEEPWTWPEPGVVLIVPFIAGAAAGAIYHRLAVKRAG